MASNIDNAANAMTPIAMAKAIRLSNVATTLKIAKPPIMGASRAAVDGLRGPSWLIGDKNRTPAL